jgi:hypothetical protein
VEEFESFSVPFVSMIPLQNFSKEITLHYGDRIRLMCYVKPNTKTQIQFNFMHAYCKIVTKTLK